MQITRNAERPNHRSWGNAYSNNLETRASRRRRLFTPTTQLQFTPPAQTANQNAVDINTRPGTMVFRIEEHGHANSGKTGVILRTTAGPSPRTLDILWTSDATVSTAIPSKLRIMQAPQRPTLAGTTTPPSRNCNLIGIDLLFATSLSSAGHHSAKHARIQGYSAK